MNVKSVLKNLSLWLLDNTRPETIDRNNTVAIRNALIEIILLSFCKSKPEITTAAKPKQERINSIETEAVLIFFAKKKHAMISNAIIINNTEEMILPVLLSKPVNERFWFLYLRKCR